MQTRDAIEVLTHDHREVEQMFTEFDAAAEPAERQRIADQVVIELVRHSVVEEEYLYPTARQSVSGGDALVERELREHAEAERVMNRLDGLGPSDPAFDATMRELMAAIKEHVAEEEGELFPRLRRAITQDELRALGEKLQSAKKMAPTRPHPLAPDTPPWNKMAAPGAALVDRMRDWITGRGKQG